MEHFFLETYWGGAVILVIGVLKTAHTIRRTKRNMNSVLQPYTSGLVAGIGLSVAGLAIIITKLLG